MDGRVFSLSQKLSPLWAGWFDVRVVDRHFANELHRSRAHILDRLLRCIASFKATCLLWKVGEVKNHFFWLIWLKNIWKYDTMWIEKTANNYIWVCFWDQIEQFFLKVILVSNVYRVTNYFCPRPLKDTINYTAKPPLIHPWSWCLSHHLRQSFFVGNTKECMQDYY